MDNLQLLTTWMDLTNRMLSKGSQCKRVQTVKFRLYKVQNQAKLTHGVRSQDSAYLWGPGVKTRKRSNRDFWGAGDVLFLDLHGS